MYKPTLNSSLIQKRNKQATDFATSLFGNASFRLGMIMESFDVEDDKNISKLGPEYTVMTVEQDKSNGQNTVIYKNVIAMDGFGSVADFFQFTHRKAKKPKKAKKKGSLKDEVASIVGLLCLDGNSEKAVIIGSFGNPSKGVVLSKEKKHNMEGEFNGINWTIDKDGALLVTFKSATDDDGNPKNAAAGGTFISIDKTGSFEVSDGLSSSIKMDKNTQNMTIKSGLDIKQEAVGNIEIEAGGNATVSASNWAVNVAQGSAIQTSLEWEVEVLGISTIKTTTMDIKAKAKMDLEAPLFNIKGKLINIEGKLVTVGGLGGLPALLFNTQFIGTGNLGAPVISQAIGPFSTSVFIK